MTAPQPQQPHPASAYAPPAPPPAPAKPRDAWLRTPSGRISVLRVIGAIVLGGAFAMHLLAKVLRLATEYLLT